MASTKQKPKCDNANDARRSVSGCHSGWLTKAKSNDARAKWFTSSTRRFFTIDYNSQILFYSRSESDKKISQPIAFSDIIGACPLPEGGANTFGFVLRTKSRDYELFAQSEWDVALWVAGLNRARDSVDVAASDDSTSAGVRSASGISTPSSQGSPRSSDLCLDHGPRGPKGGYPESCAVIRQRSPSPVGEEDPFEALEALEAMMGLGAQEVAEANVPPESFAGQSQQNSDARKVVSQCSTAHVAALALTQHNVEADAWDSDDDDEDSVQDGVGCGKGSQVSGIVDFTKNHNALADVWDSDDEEEALEVQPAQALAQEITESTPSNIRSPSHKHDSVNETQDERKARKEARREARRAEGETEEERDARREARRERRSKRSALEQSAAEAKQVEPPH
jgi:hypothetical protein